MSGNLQISVGANRPEEDDRLIYTERTVGGYASVLKTRNPGSGRLDLELLFKAAIANPATCSSLVETESRT